MGPETQATKPIARWVITDPQGHADTFFTEDMIRIYAECDCTGKERPTVHLLIPVAMLIPVAPHPKDWGYEDMWPSPEAEDDYNLALEFFIQEQTARYEYNVKNLI